MNTSIVSCGRKILCSFILSGGALLAGFSAGAANYYVATNGVDSNAGTIRSPFKTLAAAVTHLGAGDTLYIRGGTYREVLQPVSSGTSSQPILITSYSNEVATISGADILTNAWTYTNGPGLNSANIYKTTVTTSLGDGRNQIFVDGEMMVQARFPNFGSGDLLHANFSTVNVSTNAGATNQISCPDWAVFADNALVGARAFVSVGPPGGLGYNWQTAQIQSSHGTNVVVDPRTFVNGLWYTGGGPGYVYGLLSMLDTNSEWHLDTSSSTLYLQTPTGDDPTGHLVEMKTRNLTLSMSNLSYVTINGLQFRAGGVVLNGANLVVQNCDCRYLSHYLLFPYVGLVPGAPSAWDQGLNLAGINTTVQGCHIYDSASSGIYLSGSNNVITRNLISDIDYAGISGGNGGAGINIDGTNQTMTFNTISNVGWAGLSPNNDGQTGHKVMYNDIIKVNEMNHDSGGIYIASGANLQGNRVAYNWFHDYFPFRFSAVLIYLDSGATNYTVDHNVGFNQVGRMATETPPNNPGNRFYNNTFFNTRPMDAAPSDAFHVTNNLYLAWNPASQLVDWQGKNFSLQPSSPSIDAGLVIPGITDGYVGSAPDLGAYEFGGPYWVPGIYGWTVDQPGVYSSPPLSWSSSTAVLQGTLMSAGTSATMVYVYWGTSDGGTNTASWMNNTNLGTYTTNPVPLSYAITNLLTGSNYAYRFFATNASGTYWSAVQNFVAGGGVWISDGGTNWSKTNQWRDGIVADGANNLADFSTVNLSKERTLILDTARTIGALRFGDTSPSFNWLLVGPNALTLALTNASEGPYIEVSNQMTTISVVLAGTGGLEKRGAGSLNLNGVNTYTGTTLLTAGNLMLNGVVTGGNTVVTRNGTLGGTGTISEPIVVQSGGTLSPGTGTNGTGNAGTLIVGDLSLTNATLVFDLANTTSPGGGTNDLISMSGGVLVVSNFLNGTIAVKVNPLNTFITNGSYTLISGASAIMGDVSRFFTAPGLPGVTFSTNTGTGPYNVYMNVAAPLGHTLAWLGTAGATWDAGTTPSWTNLLTHAKTTFSQTDAVTFDDLGVRPSLTLSGSLAPSSVTVNNSATNYTFSGSGNMTGSMSLTKTGTGTLTIGTTNDYTGSTAIQQGLVVVTVTNGLPATTTLTLGYGNTNSPSVGNLDLSLGSQTVGALNVASVPQVGTFSPTFSLYDTSLLTNTVTIGATHALTVNGNVTAGSSQAGGILLSYSTFTGPGAFVVTSATAIFQINANTATSNGNGTITVMDMSSLGSANINLGTNGSMYLGLSNGGSGGSPDTLLLATNTTITATNILVGNSTGGNAEVIKLGAGSNIINAATMSLGTSRDYGQVFFNTTNGNFKMRGQDGVSRSSLIVGASSGTMSGAPNQFMDLGAHVADLYLNVLTVGEDNRASGGAPTGSSNYFGFANGTLDTTGLRIGNRSSKPVGVPAVWYNVVSIGGGTVSVGANGIVMDTSLGAPGTISPASGTNSAVLNLNGGTVTVNGNVQLLNQSATNFLALGSLNITGGANTINGNIYCTNGVASPGPRTATLTLNGSTAVLDLAGHVIGGVTAVDALPGDKVDVLNLQAGTLQNVAQINQGAGFTKTGAGRLTLAGVNTYTGDTVINSGTLLISSGPQPSSTFVVNAGAELELAVNNTNTTTSLPGLTLNNPGISALQFDFPSVPSTTVAALTVTALTPQGGSNTVTINLTGALAVGQFPLIKYAGSIGGSVGFNAFQLGILPAGVSASLVNNTANSSVDVLVYSLSASLLTWTGTVSSSWDVDLTANWQAGGVGHVFRAGSLVQFDDTATGPTAVTLNQFVTPASVTFSNNSQNYTLSGSGGLNGSASLTKLGSGAVILGAANNYTGPTALSNGSLTISTAQQGGGAFTVNDGAWLDVMVTGAGTMPMSALTLGVSSASTLEFDFFANPSTSVAPVVAGGLTVNGSSISIGGHRPPVGQYPLIKYGGTISGAGFAGLSLGTVPPGVTAMLVNNTANQSVDLKVTALGQTNLLWNGLAGGTWDVGISTNWQVNGTPQFYLDQNSVQFDDTATGPALVTLNTNVNPSGVIFSNSAKNYTLSGSGFIAGGTGLNKRGSGTLTLNNTATDTYTNATAIQNGTVIIGVDNPLPVKTAVSLGDTSGHAGSLDLSSASLTVGGLTVVSLSPVTNSITIGSGKILTVNGTVTAGAVTTVSTFTNQLNMTGAGSLAVAASTFQVGGTDGINSAGTGRTILDMSGLAAAGINLGASGTCFVGDQSSSGGGDLRSTWITASNTTLTAKTLAVGSSSRGVMQTLQLGPGSNVFYVNTILMDGSRDFGRMYFQTNTGTLKIRGTNGDSARAGFFIATNSGTSFAATNQGVDLGSHAADLLLSMLTVGEEDRGGGGTTYSSNFFDFASGTLDTTGLRLGNRVSNPSSTGALWYNICNFGGGSVMIGSNGIVMGTGRGQNGPQATNTATLNISGGTVSVGGRILLLSQNATTGNNVELSSLNISGGSLTVGGPIYCYIPILNPATHLSTLALNGPGALLDLGGYSIGNTNGDTNAYVDVVNFQQGTLQNVGEINGGAPLVKNGSGLLTLAGVNNYTGATLINGGTLNVTGQLNGGGLATIATGAVLTGNGYAGSVSNLNGGAISPGIGGSGVADTLVTSNLTLNSGAILAFDLANITTPGGGVNDLINLPGAMLTLNGTVTVLPNLLNGALVNGTYTIVSNAVAILGDVTTLLTMPSVRGVTFSTNAGAGPYNVYMTVSGWGTGQSVVWTGLNVSPNWDTGGTVNWSNTVSHLPDTFRYWDAVSFDDTASSGTVNLVGALLPSSVLVTNSSINYGFGGSGQIGGTGNLIKAGSGTLTLSNTTPDSYTGFTLIKNGAMIIASNNVLPATTLVTLGDSNAPTAGSLSLPTGSQTIGGLATISTNTLAVNTVTIGDSQTLTVNGNVIAGNVLTLGKSTNLLTVLGTGTLAVNTNGGTFQVNANTNTTLANGTKTTLDMSALASATVSLGTGGFYVGERSGGVGGMGATIVLATNSTITADSLNIGNSTGVNGETMKLGAGSNIFNLNSMNLGVSRDYGQVYFNTTSGSLKLRAADGASRTSLIIAPNTGTTSGATNQFMELGAHVSDLFLSLLTVGEDNRGSSGVPYSSNYFGFAGGTLDTTGLRIGNRPSNPPSSGALWYNTVNLGGGTITIGTNGITMGTSIGTGSVLGTNAAVLNISGGTVLVNSNIVLLKQLSTNYVALGSLIVTGGTNTINGNIYCTNGVVSPAIPATHIGTLTLNGSTAMLDLTEHAIGGTSPADTVAAHWVDVLNFQAGTLQNVAQINAGSPLVKTGAGTLTLAGTNYYSGSNVVSSGSLMVMGTNFGLGLTTVAANATLGGTGMLSGVVIVNSGGTLMVAANSGIPGTLTINSNLTLNGTNSLVISKGNTPNCDLIHGINALNYGGTLNVTNVGGTLASGDSFKLFNATTYAGSFITSNLPPLGTGLFWDTSALATSGTIQVAGGPGHFVLPISPGKKVTLSGKGGPAGGTYFVVTMTNLNAPASEWTIVATNHFGSDGSYNISFPIQVNEAQRFYLLKLP